MPKHRRINVPIGLVTILLLMLLATPGRTQAAPGSDASLSTPADAEPATVPVEWLTDGAADDPGDAGIGADQADAPLTEASPDEPIDDIVSAAAEMQSAAIAVSLKVSPGELTYGSTKLYTITVPAQPVNETLENVLVTDEIDSNLTILDVSNGSIDGNLVTASFATILPNTRQTIVIRVQLPADSSAPPNTLIPNQATLTYSGGETIQSATVTSKVVVPALVVGKQASQIDISYGYRVEYTVRIQNVGNARTQSLLLTEQWPENQGFVAGSATLNGAPLANPLGHQWILPGLAGKTSHVVTYKLLVYHTDDGQAYPNVTTVQGLDSRGLPIRPDQSSRLPADTDPDDRATAIIYGPLNWDMSSTYVAYEDLKNVGWSDWDYNDFIVKLEVERGRTGDGNLAALRIRYEPMAAGGAFNHQLLHRLPVSGGAVYSLLVSDSDGQPVKLSTGEVVDYQPITIFEYTRRALPAPPGASPDKPFTNTLPEQTETLRGWSARLQVVLLQADANPLAALPPIPWDPYLYVHPTGQEVHLLQPGHLDNTQAVNSTYDPNNPLVGYDLPLAQQFAVDWLWPQEFRGLWRVYLDYPAFVFSNGSTNANWWNPSQARTNLALAWQGGAGFAAAGLAAYAEPLSRYFATPTVADLDQDGTQEIIIGNLVKWQLEVYNADGAVRTGWPRPLQGEIKASAAVADLDQDGDLEILVGDGRGYLHAFYADGQAVADWPVLVGGETTSAGYRILSRPLVTDLDNDHSPDVVVASSNGRLYAFNAQGQRKANWPVSLGEVADQYGNHLFDSSPVAADLDGDGLKEILVGSYDKQLYVYHADGTLVWTFATGDAVIATPAVGELDRAHTGLEIAIASGDSYLYLLDSTGALLWKRPTGWIIRSSPLLADLDGDGALEILVGSDDYKVWAWHANGELVAGWPQSAGAAVVASPVHGDIDGDGKAEVVVPAEDGLVYAWHEDGTPVMGWPQASGAPVKSAVVLLNLDEDQAMEVVAATMDGELIRFGVGRMGQATHQILLPIVTQ
jgi:LruC domain-containing protein/uncharacterized repeat protein (TIGR01451 family)